MEIKLKFCAGCSRERKIWKSEGKLKYCEECWNKKLAENPKPKEKRYYTIPQVSKKRAKENIEYLKVRLEYLNEHPMCEAHILGICNQFSTTIHHKEGRIGDLLIDKTKFLACCGPCHNYIEVNVLWAKEQGFSLERNKKE